MYTDSVVASAHTYLAGPEEQGHEELLVDAYATPQLPPEPSRKLFDEIVTDKKLSAFTAQLGDTNVSDRQAAVSNIGRTFDPPRLKAVVDIALSQGNTGLAAEIKAAVPDQYTLLVVTALNTASQFQHDDAKTLQSSYDGYTDKEKAAIASHVVLLPTELQARLKADIHSKLTEAQAGELTSRIDRLSIPGALVLAASVVDTPAASAAPAKAADSKFDLMVNPLYWRQPGGDLWAVNATGTFKRNPNLSLTLEGGIDYRNISIVKEGAATPNNQRIYLGVGVAPKLSLLEGRVNLNSDGRVMATYLANNRADDLLIIDARARLMPEFNLRPKAEPNNVGVHLTAAVHNFTTTDKMVALAPPTTPDSEMPDMPDMPAADPVKVNATTMNTYWWASAGVHGGVKVGPIPLRASVDLALLDKVDWDSANNKNDTVHTAYLQATIEADLDYNLTAYARLDATFYASKDIPEAVNPQQISPGQKLQIGAKWYPMKDEPAPKPEEPAKAKPRAW